MKRLIGTITVIVFLLSITFSFSGYSCKANDMLFDINNDVFYIEKELGEDFVILQLTDTHINFKDHDYSWNDENILSYMRKWVDEVNPDLIALTGDVVNGVTDGTNKDLYTVIDFMNELGKPWAYIFGNHEKDSSGGIKELSSILMREAKRENSLLIYNEHKFEKEYAPDWIGTDSINDRYGNYVITVTQKGKPIYSLFFICDAGNEYQTFLPTQAEWYKQGVIALSEKYYGTYSPFTGKVIPSMIFHHIPTDEYQYASNNVLTTHLTKNGYIYDNVMVGVVPPSFGSGENAEFAYGQRDEIGKGAYADWTELDKNNVEYAMYNDARSHAGFFDIVKDLHSTTHMFCGHRHTNDATILYQGVYLTFGTKTGRGNFSGKKSGATTITVKDKSNKVTVSHNYD